MPQRHPHSTEIGRFKIKKVTVLNISKIVQAWLRGPQTAQDIHNELDIDSWPR
jgi:hypothetical protein